MTEEALSVTVEQIAEICHEANRVWCRQHDDDSQLPWAEAPTWQKEGAMRGVRAALSGAAKSPREQHEAWMNDKLRDGWKWGETKDAETKTHPCLVPWRFLPAEQQAKDALFRAIALAFHT